MQVGSAAAIRDRLPLLVTPVACDVEFASAETLFLAVYCPGGWAPDSDARTVKTALAQGLWVLVPKTAICAGIGGKHTLCFPGASHRGRKCGYCMTGTAEACFRCTSLQSLRAMSR
jgi:hypothetical protein